MTTTMVIVTQRVLACTSILFSQLYAEVGILWHEHNVPRIKTHGVHPIGMIDLFDSPRNVLGCDLREHLRALLEARNPHHEPVQVLWNAPDTLVTRHLHAVCVAGTLLPHFADATLLVTASLVRHDIIADFEPRRALHYEIIGVLRSANVLRRVSNPDNVGHLLSVAAFVPNLHDNTGQPTPVAAISLDLLSYLESNRRTKKPANDADQWCPAPRNDLGYEPGVPTKWPLFLLWQAAIYHSSDSVANPQAQVGLLL
mmetsp:Transcript_81921/g.228325  ORF Transcript_81921/g.228325 Transcript_81921/m.228325 type:complete len:256 (+) Transcript_81921:57-824(+)